MATPALWGLKNLLKPKGRLSLLALKPGIQELAENSGWFDNVYFWDPDKEPLLKGLKLLSTIRQNQYDLSLSLFPTGHWKFALFHFWAGARTKRGFAYPHAKLARWVQDFSLTYQENDHDVDQNKNLVTQALSDSKIPVTFLEAPGLTIPQTVGQETAQKDPQKYFICHPGSSSERGMDEKRLPQEALATIIKEICTQFKLVCLIVGGPEEQSLKEKIRHSVGARAQIAKTSGIIELCDVIRQSEFFLGNDSGIMHLSEALQKRCAVFFGPSNERRTGPYIPESQKNSKVPFHLILRHPQDNLETFALQSLPPSKLRLAFAGQHHLNDLTWQDCKKELTEFVTDVLRRG